MVSLALVQMIMSYTVYLHVKNDLLDSLARPLLTAYEMFVGLDNTIPFGVVETLCGVWEDQEAHVGKARGPLSARR